MGKNVLSLDLLRNFPGTKARLLHRIQRSGCLQLAGHIGKLPKPCQKTGIRPFLQRIAAITGENEHSPLLFPLALFRKLHRVLLCSAMERATTKLLAGTLVTLWCPVGAAERGTQFHQRLRKFPRFGRIHRLQRRRNRFFLSRQINGRCIFHQSGKNAQHIPVHRRPGLIEANGADCSGCIISNSGQGADFLVFLRKFSAMLLHNLDRSLF